MALSNSPAGGSGGSTAGDIALAVWSATTRSLTAAVFTDSASRTATAALVTGFATPANITDAQAAIIAKADVSVIGPQVATLFGLVQGGDRFSTTALANTPTTAILDAIAQKPVTPVTDLTNLFTAITTAKAEILNRGNLAWTTGTGVPGDSSPITDAIAALEVALLAELGPIAADAIVARQGVVNDASIDEEANTGTIYQDDGTTPLVTFDLQPTAGNAITRIRQI